MSIFSIFLLILHLVYSLQRINQEPAFDCLGKMQLCAIAENKRPDYKNLGEVK